VYKSWVEKNSLPPKKEKEKEIDRNNNNYKIIKNTI